MKIVKLWTRIVAFGETSATNSRFFKLVQKSVLHCNVSTSFTLFSYTFVCGLVDKEPHIVKLPKKVRIVEFA